MQLAPFASRSLALQLCIVMACAAAGASPSSDHVWKGSFKATATETTHVGPISGGPWTGTYNGKLTLVEDSHGLLKGNAEVLASGCNMGGSPSAKHITADVTGTDNGKQLELRIVGMHTDGITCGFATGWVVAPGRSPSCAVIPITAPGTAQGLWHGDGKLPPSQPTAFVTTNYQFALTCSGCKGLPGATLGGHSEGPLSGISFASEISIAAAANHLDPTLLAAIAAQETGGPSSDSGQNIKGDCTPNCHGYGVFQIDDRSHSDFTSTPQAMNPAVNAEYAATMMQDLLAKYGGDIHKALSSYNAGGKGNRCGTKTFWKANGDTLCYADSVLRHQGRIKNRKVGSCQ